MDSADFPREFGTGGGSVSAFFFAYTIAMIVLTITAAVLSFATFIVTHRRSHLVESAFFIIYTAELVGIFGTEWLFRNLPVETIDFYGIENPILRTLLGAGLLMCFWAIMLNHLDELEPVRLVVPILVYILASYLVLVNMPYGALRQWLFYTLRQIFIAFGLIYALYRYLRSDDPDFRRRLERHAHTYSLLWAFLLAVVVEDCGVILVMPQPTGDSALPLFLSSRNISETIAVGYFAYRSIRHATDVLSLRFNAPPETNFDVEHDRSLRTHVEESLPAFSSNYGLSARESEVLAKLIEGKDNRTIAEELYLAEGTIKTHVHKIMVKTGTSSRQELKQAFWSR